MKSFLILLFIPFIGFSQISFSDIMRLNSLDKFKRLVIENGFEYESNDDDWLIYGFNIVKDSLEGNKSSKWAYYNTKDNRFALSFSRTTALGSLFGVDEKMASNPYDRIVADIKKKCKYYKIINYKGTDYVAYSCSGSSYKGKIGFVVSEGSGIIRHFVKY